MQSRRPSGPPLPSIRTLHPYLPPPSTMPAEPLPASTSSTALATSSPATLDRRRPSTDAGSDEYDHDLGDGDHPRGEDNDSESEQPRRKRRRQALSCTECKRRKIRCDRAQPCGPCSRRGDEAKCKWHIVELASEKYVPRSEYDALKKRVEALEDYLRQIPPPRRRFPPLVLFRQIHTVVLRPH
uniref:C6 transcriptional factoral factor n=1 Tax=Mycena chlorophos TaxID=658473 RepID=A0ABQ0LA17_MYCCL|nr:C6 transcriptional factoral factor [Mycena chlorophos]